MAVKIHYDHRASLPSYLKYSRAPTYKEYQEYLKLFREENIGGEGFHECLNFSIPENDNVKIYLSPTCIPNKKYFEEDFVIFSFTYKYDREVSACIVGVHASATLLSGDNEGIKRDDAEIGGLTSLTYHAEAPADYVTLITPPIEYDFKAGLYTPEYKMWGNGLRYIEEEHAQNIIEVAISKARKKLPLSSGTEYLVVERQLNVLNAIHAKYFNSKKNGRISVPIESNISEPDKEIGYLGEKIVYERELAYALEHGIPSKEVQWISQSVPLSPFDIKSVRVTKNGFREHFIEVKSSKALANTNIYVSSGQVTFFKENEDCATFMLVHFDVNKNFIGSRELSFAQLTDEFELTPIKYKLRSKVSNGT